jgi:hypothetical protein
MLSGKGWFIWQISRCEQGNPSAIADKALDAGATHVLVKVAERSHAFGFSRDGQDMVPALRQALRERGIGMWGWHYVYGDSPVDEARIAVRRSVQLQLDGYVIDAEAEYRQPGKAAAARSFMSELRDGLPSNIAVALSSFRYPSLHRQLPWQAFLEACDLVMPQVYWEKAHNSAAQLERSVNEFGNTELVGYVRPVVPTGAAYGTGGWRSAPADITHFLDKARTLGLSGANLYSWDYATSPGNTDLWEAAAKFEWTGTRSAGPGSELPMLYIEALNSGDVRQVLALYHANAGHVTDKHFILGQHDLAGWFETLTREIVPHGRFQLLSTSGMGNSSYFRWTASAAQGEILDGEDTLGLLDGRIQYHYTSFTVTRP